jgi:hypothetical protein
MGLVACRMVLQRADCGASVGCRHPRPHAHPLRQLCRRNSSLCSFLESFSDLPLNFDRILTESSDKLTES